MKDEESQRPEVGLRRDVGVQKDLEPDIPLDQGSGLPPQAALAQEQEQVPNQDSSSDEKSRLAKGRIR